MLNILIVEDKLLTATDIKKTLENAGHHVTAIARSAQQATEAVGRQFPDLVLLDIYLAGPRDGISVAEEILAQKQIPIIILTANREDEIFQRAKEVFIPAAYITKPFRHVDLPRLVELAWRNFQPRPVSAETSVLPDMVFLPVEKRYEKIVRSEVVYISTQKGTHAVTIFEAFRKQPRLVNLSIGYLEPYFNTSAFFRLSRSLIINLSYIQHIENSHIKLEGSDIALLIPESKRAELLKRLTIIRGSRKSG